MCPGVPNPLHGRVAVTGQHIGGQAVYSCDGGYVMVGESVHQCQQSGQWSGDPPQCGEHRMVYLQ